MAERVKVDRLCDMPKHAKPEQVETDVETFFIRLDSIEVRVDLCSHHSGPIMAAFHAGTRTTPTKGDLPVNTRAALERRFRQG